MLLAKILEKAYNKPIDVLVNNLIHQQQLSNTYYSSTTYSKKILKSLAHGYFNNTQDVTDINPSWIQSAGGLLSNPADMTLWMKQYISNSKYNNIFSLINTKDGSPANSSTPLAYSFGIFRKKTRYGYIYFTPGLTSGYISLVGYIANLDTYFSYSITRAPISNFNDYMITNICNILATSKKNSKRD